MSTRIDGLAPNAIARRSRAGLGLELARVIELWVERHRQRRALAGLGEHLLKDVGISPADAWQESQKPFWRG